MTEPAAQRLCGKNPPVALMGVPFENLTMDETVRIVDGMIRCGRPHCLVTANVDFLAQSLGDAELHRVLLEADMVLCDGTPLLWLSKLVGNPLPERVAGSDLTPRLLELADKKGYRVFLLGGEKESNRLAAENIGKLYPGLVLCGRYAPSYAPLAKMDHAQILGRIRRARPDLLLVSFGCPKQEKWISMNRQNLAVPVVIGVGATIDFLAGRVPRAPVWMRRCGLEWVFRLICEPRRLSGRYARDLVFFARFVLAQWWRTRLSGMFVGACARPPVVQCAGKKARIVLSGRLDGRAVDRYAGALEEAMERGGICEWDLSGVRYMDSAGIGLLLRCWKLERGNPPVLFCPPKPVRAALRLMRLEGFFRTVTS